METRLTEVEVDYVFYLFIINCLEALEEVEEQAREAGSDSMGRGWGAALPTWAEQGVTTAEPKL